MRETRILMGMPVTVEVAGTHARQAILDKVFDYFKYVDEKFSTYKETSEISAINKHQLSPNDYSQDMKLVLRLCEETKQLTNGYFNIQKQDGTLDPSGLVKGWSIYNAAKILDQDGFKNFYVDAGGDIETRGLNAEGKVWSVGIKNPFKQEQIVKVLIVPNKGIATSGTYIRGNHIYNPKAKHKAATEIASLSVIGPNIYEADRFATAAFAMGKDGINFIEKLEGFEGYSIDTSGVATITSGFEQYVNPEHA